MKKWSFLFLSLSLFLGSCSKSAKCIFSDSNATATASEIAYLQNYMTTNTITATQHSSGIFYTITDPGTGATASVCSNITLTYTGSLLSNGNVFDFSPTSAGTSFLLGQLIIGWQKGLPLIKNGGQITLYIPPSLGYGGTATLDSHGNVAIPANSYLKFVMHLLDVQ